MKTHIMCAWLLAVGLIALLSATAVAMEKAYVKDGEIWTKKNGTGNAVQLTRDGKAKALVGTSPDGRRIAYFVTGNQQDKSESTVVILDQQGHKLSEFRPNESEGTPYVSINSAEWIDNAQLGMECHVNPSMSSYLVADASTGKTKQNYLGFNFVWSPDKHALAHVGQMVHFAPWPHSEYVQLNDKTVYPKGGAVYGDDKVKVHTFVGAFTWSPDGRNVAVLDALSGKEKGAELVLISLGGKVTVKKLPIKDESSCKDLLLKWESQTRISVRGKNCQLTVDTES
ncbi:MAG: hypothetical protein K2X81_16875 [Candidatus Obscuribacterales bacterium]|nr:hypothetical protein [Candidatus Obscuribacterales bacterium]